jgi:phosphatidylethanolamine-binding protein (PEBP) family uncharacterized protein
MVDPDAPSRDDAVKGPVLHWLVANFQGKDLEDGHTLCKVFLVSYTPKT